jgi:hypothetical protein
MCRSPLQSSGALFAFLMVITGLQYSLRYTRNRYNYGQL